MKLSELMGGLSDHVPTAAQWTQVFLLRDYNTRVVLLGATLLGVSSGLIGAFMLLRKRALLGDAISHATLPGVAFAFLFMTAAGGTGKWLPGLLLGAFVSGLLGIGAIAVIRNQTRLKEDAALGVVLSVFFGLGVTLLGVIQKMKSGHAAGLESFIYGKTASMLAADAQLIAASAFLIAVVCVLLFKEFRLLCFDPEFARAQGWPTALLDGLMMGLVVAVTVIGLQAVGLILVIALLIIPAAAARFWTENLAPMIGISAALGAASGWVGASWSALVTRLPAGAIIVIVAGCFFLVSLLFGASRGIVFRWIRHRRLTARITRQHVLRALYECVEGGAADTPVAFERLRMSRRWSPRALRRALRRLIREGHLERTADRRYRLTASGLHEARRVVRNHRLWETYLITHADIAPSHVDRDADEIEHVLGEPMIRELEAVLDAHSPRVPDSPHATGGVLP